MPDHFRRPLTTIASWEELHGQWPAVIVQQLRKQLPPGYVSGPRVHAGAQVGEEKGTRIIFLTGWGLSGIVGSHAPLPACCPGGFVYHALNRAVARLPLFEKPADYEAFERVLAEALQEHPTRLLAYCLMPNHWHFVLWPERDGELTAFLRWLTHTHTQRWHAHYHSAGTGHLYQGRFKAFPIQEDDHFYGVVRYVERNPLRANLVAAAEKWPWSSLGRPARMANDVVLHPWPVPRPKEWIERVNRPQSNAELEAVRQALARSRPYGDECWQQRTARQLGLEYTLRPRGRPKKAAADAAAEEQPQK